MILYYKCFVICVSRFWGYISYPNRKAAMATSIAALALLWEKPGRDLIAMAATANPIQEMVIRARYTKPP